MAKNKVTTDELTAMIQHGFAEAARKDDVDKGFDAVEKRLDGIEDKLESIEKFILADHKRRIDRLEDQVKDLRDLMAAK
jgi:polyhydroxyalkanoate synthesis regulator phasin